MEEMVKETEVVETEVVETVVENNEEVDAKTAERLRKFHEKEEAQRIKEGAEAKAPKRNADMSFFITYIISPSGNSRVISSSDR